MTKIKPTSTNPRRHQRDSVSVYKILPYAASTEVEGGYSNSRSDTTPACLSCIPSISPAEIVESSSDEADTLIITPLPSPLLEPSAPWIPTVSPEIDYDTQQNIQTTLNEDGTLGPALLRSLVEPWKSILRWITSHVTALVRLASKYLIRPFLLRLFLFVTLLVLQRGGWTAHVSHYVICLFITISVVLAFGAAVAVAVVWMAMGVILTIASLCFVVLLVACPALLVRTLLI